jgi:3-oxoisoapionate kinase
MTPTRLPDGPLVVFYGDDYTGSSAAMEALAFAGLQTMLFLEPPTPQQLAAAAHCRGIGIAGIARSQNNGWMDQNLPPIFGTLAGIGAPISHYKVCSTFDSAPHISSIGHTIDLAVPLLGGLWHPMVVASPAMGRYQLFGNLFATVHGTGYRLDRHPTMSLHPVTPMDEADLGVHLAGQTRRRIGLVDFIAMTTDKANDALGKQRANGAEIISLDVLDQRSLVEAGRLMWENRGERLFAIGSQGGSRHWSPIGNRRG